MIAARQTTTRRWWMSATTKLQLLVSQIVLDECSAGDPASAQERLAEIDAFSSLDITEAVRGLADQLISNQAVPATEPRDALHIAVAAVHGVQDLVTWNFKHIANATLRGRIEDVCRDAGFEPPIICTPEELAGDDSNDAD
jgi:predicted nucleic acid-binding protein